MSFQLHKHGSWQLTADVQLFINDSRPAITKTIISTFRRGDFARHRIVCVIDYFITKQQEGWRQWPAASGHSSWQLSGGGWLLALHWNFLVHS
jgi:hypothetical protein